MIRRYDFHSVLLVYGFTPRIRLVLLEQAFGAELPLFPNSVEKFERGNHKRDQNRKFSNIFDKRFHRKDQHSVRPRVARISFRSGFTSRRRRRSKERQSQIEVAVDGRTAPRLHFVNGAAEAELVSKRSALCSTLNRQDINSSGYKINGFFDPFFVGDLVNCK